MGVDRLSSRYPDLVLCAIGAVAKRFDVDVFVVGGTVRDLLRGVVPRDLDLAVSRSALDFARTLSTALHGTFVLLDETEQTARVVWNSQEIDIAGYRGGAEDIEGDLLLRDFTINAMAVPFADCQFTAVLDGSLVIDPAGGLTDLQGGTIRLLRPQCLTDDPLRVLRAFRFFAENGFVIDPQTWEQIVGFRDLICSVAPERLSHELDRIMASHRAAAAIKLLDRAGVLSLLFPELAVGAGISQPSSHHLDVLQHNIETLRRMEEIIAHPAVFYPSHAEILNIYLAPEKTTLHLKWAALFHDLGKPSSRRIVARRITFHNHDRAGVDLVTTIAARLRWSKEKSSRISRLVAMHMWPFHLSNIRRKHKVTVKACLKLYKAAGADLPGLFLLAMADSLAGQGPGKPQGMEEELTALYAQVVDECRTRVEPVLTGPRLVTGQDLIDIGLTPGPLFKNILAEIETAQVEGKISDRVQGLDRLRQFCLSFDLI